MTRRIIKAKRKRESMSTLSNENLKPTVTVGYNNAVGLEEASKVLGCSYGHMLTLIKNNKLKAQKRDLKWMVDYDDLQRAKSTGLVRHRSPSKRLISSSEEIPSTPGFIDVRISVPRDQLEIVKLALSHSPKTLVDLLKDRFDTVYNKVQEKLQSLDI